MKQTEIDPYGSRRDFNDEPIKKNTSRLRKNIIIKAIDEKIQFLILCEVLNLGSIKETSYSLAVKSEDIDTLNSSARPRGMWSGNTANDERACRRVGYRTYDLKKHELEWLHYNKKMFKLVHECEHGEVWRSGAN